MYERVTGLPARMFGPSIIGFGEYHYKYASGHQGFAAAAGFAPRKAATTVYVLDGLGAYEDELSRLGPHKTGVGCLYLTNLEKNDLGVLEHVVASSYATLTAATRELRTREG